MAIPIRIKTDEIEYPTGDGEPMAETAIHRALMLYVITALQTHFSENDEVYVSGDDFIYYVEGDPNRRVSPDIWVAFQVGNQIRDCYKVWEEGGKMPDVVMELTSKSTQREDVESKFRLYEQRLRVPEYFLFDPTADYLTPILQGYRLVNGRYERIQMRNNRLVSEQLGLELVLEDGTLRLIDPVTGWRYLTPAEEHERAERERQRAENEHNRAENEHKRAESEASVRAEAEQRARLAEEQLARLQAELESLRGGNG